jgi:sec-independent protein translocase protein TatC
MFKKTTYISIHFNELKISFLLYFITFLFLFFLNYLYIDQIIYLLIKPIIQIKKTNHFILSTISEAFFVKTYCAFYITLIILIPFIFLHFWYILSEGLYKHENIFILKTFFIIIFVYILGFIFIYKLIIPNSWNFFIYYEKTNNNFLYNIFLEPRLDKYINITLNILIYFNIFFQYPLILLVFLKKFIKHEFFIKYRKILYTKILILATILSPPDIFSQIFLTLPTVFLFEFLIIINIFLKKYKLNILNGYWR